MNGRLKVLDVLGLGCVAIDDLLYVDQNPGGDGKAQVRHRERQCGGLTATALVAAARLGARAAYAGVLGTDPLSDFAMDTLAQEGVNVAHCLRLSTARPIHSTIVVERSSARRAIFFDLSGAQGAADDGPSEALIASARVLLVDPLGIPGMIRAATIARKHGIPVVADFESDESDLFPELLELVDHLILSEGFARRLTRRESPDQVCQALWHARREAVVITRGEQGCYYLARGASHVVPRPAYAVATIDTTGCGDVFHGAYAAELARGADLPRRLDVASAAAAIKATRRGAQQGIPMRAEVDRFLASA